LLCSVNALWYTSNLLLIIIELLVHNANEEIKK